MLRKKIILGLSVVLLTSSLYVNIAFAETAVKTNTSNAVRIDNRVVSLTGTVVSKPTNDGTAYILNTNEGSYGVIGPNAKSISAYANTDKKITVTGNPAVGVKIIVMTSFISVVSPSTTTSKVAAEVKASTITTTNSTSSSTTSTANAVRIDNRVVSLTGTVVSKPTNDGTAYILNTNEGSYGVIGPNAKSISAYANTDKKITVTGNPAVGVKIIVMTSFTEVVPSSTTTSKAVAEVKASTIKTTTNALRIDSKVVTLTGTVVSKATNDGVGYMLNTLDGSFAIIGPTVKTISSYANTDKKITITGNPVVGAKIVVMTSFMDTAAAVQTKAAKK